MSASIEVLKLTVKLETEHKAKEEAKQIARCLNKSYKKMLQNS